MSTHLPCDAHFDPRFWTFKVSQWDVSNAALTAHTPAGVFRDFLLDVHHNGCSFSHTAHHTLPLHQYGAVSKPAQQACWPFTAGPPLVCMLAPHHSNRDTVLTVYYFFGAWLLPVFLVCTNSNPPLVLFKLTCFELSSDIITGYYEGTLAFSGC